MSRADLLLDFLKTFESESIYLVGDIVDGWALNSNFYWPQEHNDVIQKLLRRARKGTKVVYIPGNHDEFLRSFGDHEFGNIILTDTYTHTAVDGRKFIVMHGDQFDVVINKMKWLAHFGSWAYDVLIYINIAVVKIRNLFNLPHWSLSAWAKYKVKKAVNFIGDYEENLASYAMSKGAQGIICGHIHHPNLRDVDGITYVNCGDWVETCSAIVEHMDGTMEIVRVSS
jgi:hypothetical protein